MMPAGGRCTFLLPDHLDPIPFLTTVARELPDACRPLFLSSSLRSKDTAIVSTADDGFPRECMRALRATSGPDLVICDWTGGFGAWADDRAVVADVLKQIDRWCAKEECRLVIVAARRFMSPETAAALHTGPTCLVEVFSVGPWVYATVAVSGKKDDPFLLFPRPVRITASGVTFGAPFLPVPGRGEENASALAELYRQTFSGAPDGIVLFDPRGGFKEANKRALEMLGVTQEQFARTDLKSGTVVGSYQRALRLVATLRGKGRAVDDLDVVRPSGKSTFIHVSAALASAHIAVAILHERSTEQKRTLDLQQTVESLRLLLNDSPVPQALFVSRKLAEANNPFREMFAALLAENATPTIQQLFGKSSTSIARAIQSLAEAEGASERSFRDTPIALPDGGRREADIVARRELWGGRRAVQVTLTDVGERNALLREREASNRSLRVLVENDIAPLFVVRKGMVLRVNRSAVRLVGLFAPEDIVGKEIAAFLASRDRKSFPDRMSAAGLETETTATYECTMVSANGKPVRVEVSTQLIDFEGEPAGLNILRVLGGKSKSTEELRQRLDETTRLGRISAAVQGIDDSSVLAKASLEAVTKHLGFDGGIVYGLPESGDALRILASATLPEPVAATLAEQSSAEGVTGYVVRTMEPLHMVVDEYPAHLPYKSLFANNGVATVVYLPIAFNEKLFALLLLCDAKRRDQTDISPSVLADVSRVLGAAMETAMRYEQMRRKADLYAQTAEGIGDILYRVSASGSYELITSPVERLLNHPPAEFYRNADLWRDCVHPDDRATYSGRMGGQQGKETSGVVTYRILPKGKAEYRTVRDAFTYVRDDQGVLRAIVGSVVELSPGVAEGPEEAKQPREAVLSGTERDAEETARTLQAVVDNLGDALIITDLQGRIAGVNREFARLTGYSRQEVAGMAMPYPWLYEQEMGTVVEWISALREKHTLRDFDMTWVRKDGHHVAISLNTTLLFNANGEPRVMVNIARNISERKALAVALEEQIENVTALFELGQGLTAALDTESVLRQVARQTARTMHARRFIFGRADAGKVLTPEFVAVTGEAESVREEVMEADRLLCTRMRKALSLNPSVIDAELPILAAAVRGKELAHGAIVLLGDEERHYGQADLRLLESIATLTGIAFDRALLYEDTIRKSKEIQLRNRDLDDFTYVVSHDLKEPLITIEGYSQIVRGEYAEKLDKEGEEYLGSIVNAADRMKHLIDDLLTLSRVGRVAPSIETVAVGDVLASVLRDLDYRLKQRNAKVEVVGTLPVVRYNGTQLGLLFRNLVSNGVKFNQSPAPLVTVEVKEEAAEYEFAVRDNGIGIPREYFDRIFIIFQRLHTAEEYAGTGAGLTIVKKIVETHKGRIWLESAVGQGTTVHFTIPKG